MLDHSKDDIQETIHQGDVSYQGEIKDNRGIVMGNVYGKESHAIALTGSTQVVSRRLSLPIPCLDVAKFP